jgi:tetratricopeptide (TPR) repeat protein
MSKRKRSRGSEKPAAAEPRSGNKQAAAESASAESANAGSGKGPAGPKPERRKIPLAFRLLLPLFGLLLLALVEVILRVAGYGSAVGLFERARGADGTPLFRLNPHVAERFFFRQFEGHAVAPSRVLPVEFPVRKPPDTIRIFSLGESTTAGFPYPRNASFSGFLQEMLKDLHPGKRFEVINCGLTALNSYSILDFTPEVLRCQPDLIVIYCAHNEFYGAHGVGSLESVGTNRTLIRGFMAVQKVRLYQAAKGLAARLGRKPEGKSKTALIEVMARDQQIRRGSWKHKVAEESFRKNLAAVIAKARRAGVPVLVTTVVSNERELSPLRSAHAPGLAAQELKRWESLWRDAVGAEEAGRFEEAESLYRHTLEIDKEYAEAWFRLGALQARRERWTEARAAFEKALEFDVLHFRACPVFNDIIREIVAQAAKDKGAAPVILAEIGPALEKEAKGGVIGYDLMTDHLHPNTRGNYLIARAICDTLAQSPIAARFGDAWDGSRLRSLADYETACGYSAVERYLVASILYDLYKDFPFDQQIGREEHLELLDKELEESAQALTPEQRRQLASWSGSRNTFQLHVDLGHTFVQQQKFAEAAAEFRAAVGQTGQGAPEEYQSAWIALGFSAQKAGSRDEALHAYQEALKLPGRQAEIWYALGGLRQERHELDLALEAFDRAVQAEPDHADSLVSMALIHTGRHQTAQARACLEKAAATSAGRTVGHYHLARLDLSANDAEGAIRHLDQALQADPRHVQSLRLLGFVRMGRREYDQAESVFARALELDAANAETWYNRAIVAAARAQDGLAFECLAHVAALGNDDLRKSMQTDKNFARLREDARFLTLIEKQ